MSACVSRSGTTTAAATRVDVLPALSILSAIFTEARSTRRRRRRWATHDVGEGRLVAAMRGGLRGSVDGDAKMLLWHLLSELELVRVWRHIGHLALHLEVTWQVLLGLDHTHVNILLMRGSYLLLLLLQDFNLLGDCQLFHWGCCQHRRMYSRWRGVRTHQRSQLRRTTSMSDMQATAIGVQRARLALLLVHAGDCVRRWFAACACRTDKCDALG